jgi:indolepyruvate ferredoxin oxidoreductase, beta subunit
MTARILAVGVGGQGVLTVTRLLGEAAMAAGMDVRVGQLHGMSQRGGSVQSTCIVGAGQSSFVGTAQATALVAMEPLEALRAQAQLSPQTLAVVNRGAIPLVSQQQAPYPDVDGLFARLRERVPGLIEVDGPNLAQRAGGMQTLNMVMLGALTGIGALPFDEAWLRAAIEGLSGRARDQNLTAFDLGKEDVRT